MIPATIGRYEIKSELGRGGMATVYRAFDPRFKREVAVKMLPREFLHDPTFRARFEREAQTIAALEHPAIVPVYDFGEEDGQPYIVMRLMPGGSLADRMRQGPLKLEEVASIFNRLAPALDEAHAHGIIHRDLKPGNILFDQRGEPYLSDFGIAKLTEASAAFTGSGVIGTPAYMSPEQAKGDRDIDGRSDLYAMGAILFELLTGQTPYAADTPMGVVVKHIVEPVPQILTVKPDLPSACDTLITKAMAKDRTGRYGSASDMARAITLVSHDQPLPAEQSAVPPQSQTLVTPQPEPKLQPPVKPKPESRSTPQAQIKAEVKIDSASTPARPREPIPLWVWGAITLAGLLVLVIVFAVFISPNLPASQPTNQPPVATTAAPAVIASATRLIAIAPTATTPPIAPTATPKKLKIGLVTDTGGVNDKSFNQSAWAGVQQAAAEVGLEVMYIESRQPSDYEKNIDQFASEGYDMIVTVGFLMGDATALKARQYPNIKFAIVDSEYDSTYCPGSSQTTITDCYTDGGLANVASLMFKEDEVGFLAGVLAGGLTKNNVVCTVAGMEIPPVVRFVVGFQNGAKWTNPNVQTLNVYVPSFTDPAQGKETGASMVAQRCDVLFGVGGNTGNGGLLAAHEAGIPAIGVDVDQYFTYPEVQAALVSSAMKNVDVAVYEAIRTLHNNTFTAGVVTANLQNNGVGLAPFHDWEGQVPQTVKDQIFKAADALKVGTLSTGYPPPEATATPEGPAARILSISIQGNNYSIDFVTYGYTAQVPGQHVHFFFDTVPPEQAGVPGSGPWKLYGGPSPYTGYSVSDRPANATQICILVANHDHSVIQNTGNCVPLP